MQARIKPPLVVRQLDLVNQVWPLDIGYKEQNRPEVTPTLKFELALILSFVLKHCSKEVHRCKDSPSIPY